MQRPNHKSVRVVQPTNPLHCPSWLSQLLRDHRDSYEPDYNGHLTDHLPMMLLAMHGLGADQATIESRGKRYVRRLDPTVNSDSKTITRIDDGLGKRNAYRALVRYFDREIDRKGVDETLAVYLPKIISGWVRHAFHGTIRLAYGIRFNVESEISAGLAYLASAGPDEQLARIGENATKSDRFAWPPSIDIESSRFDDRYDEVLVADTFAVHTHVLENNEQRVTEDVLGLFNHTQGFFALHMVTGTHALGIVSEFIDKSIDGLMNAGVAAAYLAINAPMFVPNTEARPINMDFAHAVKVAFSCFDQAERLNSTRFREAFNTYSRSFS